MCPDGQDETGMRTSTFIATLINAIGPKVVALYIQCEQLKDVALKLVSFISGTLLVSYPVNMMSVLRVGLHHIIR